MTGKIHIYCGDGKGKTTAAMGLALRAVGAGKQIVILQFLKDGSSSECSILKHFPNVQLLSCHPVGKFSFQMTEEEKKMSQNACKQALQKVKELSKSADMLVLDEIMAALQGDFLEFSQVLAFLKTKPDGLEVILTGRNPPKELENIADYVSHIQKVKHPFDQGISARFGIEY